MLWKKEQKMSNENKAKVSPYASAVMFKDIEQGDNVAKGHVELIEIIAYDVVGKRKNYFDEIVDDEKSRGPFFCQDKEDEMFFRENNAKSRIETFTIQMLKSTAVKHIDNPDNVKQFARKPAEVTNG
jgi:hypothetical protein